MKLRVKGDSLRLRITPSEMRRLLELGRVEETIHFGASPDAELTYALEHGPVTAVGVRYQPGEIVVVAPTAQVQEWAAGPADGIHAAVDFRLGSLDIAVEKDWACLDRKDADNADTFPNPKQGGTC